MTMSDIKTVYTQDEVKAMMQACLKGLNASDRLMPPYYRDTEDNSFCRIDDVQEMFSQILRILNAEYNDICEAVEAAELEEQDDESGN